MKLICARQLLYEALTNVSRAAAEKSPIPALEGIKFSLRASKLCLTGYNLEIGIQTSIDVNSQDSADLIVNSRLFSEIIRKMQTDEITIVVDDNLTMTIYSGSMEYSINVIDASEYPSIPEFSMESDFKVSQAVLRDMINTTIFAVSQSDFRPILKGELFEIENNRLNIAATDSYRLAVRTEAIKSDNNIRFVVPARTLSEVSKLLKDDDDLTCDILVSKKQVVFEISGYTVFSRLLEGDYLNYRGSIPKSSVTEVIINRKELVSCLEITSLIINEKIISPVKCTFDTDSVKINCRSQMGKINDEIKAEIFGPRVEIGFNCRQLLEALKSISDEKVKLAMNGSNIPVKIVPIDGSEYAHILGVLRIKSN